MDKFETVTVNVKPEFQSNAQKAYASDGYAEYRKICRKNTMQDSRVLVFLTGFCVGMVFFYLAGKQLMIDGKLPAVMTGESISKLHNFEFYTSGFFEYVMEKRICQLIFLFICATSTVGILLSYIILGWCGFEIGLVMFTLVYQFGLKGMFFSILMLMPQEIFFLAAFVLIFNKFKADNEKNYHNYSNIIPISLRNKVTKVKKTIVILLLWYIGILSEVYINSEIIRKIALIF